jgi:hypothetical protein
MALTPEALYMQLGSLVAEMPDLATCPITPDVNRWIGRAAALVEESGDMPNLATMKVAAQYLVSNRAHNAQAIAAIVYGALAKAELNAPAATQGTFIIAGHTFDAYAAVGKVLGTAKADVLIVDGYADAVVLTDYAILAPEAVTMRLLAAESRRSRLDPPRKHWITQFGKTRPLEVRLAPDVTLHDRLIIVDGQTASIVQQSFNALAARAHTSIIRAPPEVATEKIAAYEAMWGAATPLS